MIDFTQFKFNHEFRDYQKRALDEVHKYMQDDKIHIVAAPGAGKTILALQLLIEIGKNALILVPTVALREQWVERFCEDFADKVDVTGILSNDLKNLKPLTVATYQSLHTHYKAEHLELLKLIKAQKIGLIILDEAHHLKASWCKTLDEVLKYFGNIKVISLTATPPYDVSNSEWQKYIELCGEIDAEIMIPELVNEGNLCPHQDYVYFNFPSQEQLGKIESYREERNDLFSRLCQSNELATAVSLNPGIINLEDRIDYFLNNFEYYISIRSFLKYRGIPVSEQLTKDEAVIPKFNIRFMEILLTNCLFADKNSYKDFAGYFKEIKRELNEIGAIHESQVSLVNSQKTKTLITQNIGKLNSINAIIANEYQAMQDRLKLVVITDYIREDIYEVAEDKEINVLGVIPIFKSIRNRHKEDINIAVLTGSIVIIPTATKAALKNICHERKIAEVETIELAYDFDYCEVHFSEKNRKYMVAIITELFEKQNIQVLVGTAALIGEGWDAPFVNTLVMATFISSFVTSNQIRGRAIRIDKKDTNKTANIWHLVCLCQASKEKYNLGVDYEIARKRFEAFEGVSLAESRIDRGIERLGIKEKGSKTLAEVADINERMMQVAARRDRMKEMWLAALRNYVPLKRSKIAKADCSKNIYNHHKEVIKSGIIKELIVLVLGAVALMIWGWSNIVVMIILASLMTGTAIRSWQKSKATYLINKFGKALLMTMVEMEIVERISKVVVEQGTEGISFYMAEGSTIEKSWYNDSLAEMLSPIEVPRYLVKVYQGYYQVPAAIGKNKKWAQVLEKHLRLEFRSVKLFYTKTPEGKRRLLELKMQMLTAK